MAGIILDTRDAIVEAPSLLDEGEPKSTGNIIGTRATATDDSPIRKYVTDFASQFIKGRDEPIGESGANFSLFDLVVKDIQQGEDTFGKPIKYGYANSITGMRAAGGLPEPGIADEVKKFTTAQRMAMNLATLVSDIPYYAFGGLIGGLSGGPAAPFTAAGGAWGFHAGLRRTLVDMYDKGEVTSYADFYSRLTGAVWDTAKGYATGVATAGAGTAAKSLGKIIGPVAALPTEVATMVGVGSALEGRIPEPMEFVDTALAIGILHASTFLPSIPGRLEKARIDQFKRKLYDVYVETGRRPRDVLRDMQSDPDIEADMMADHSRIPSAYLNDQGKVPEGWEGPPKPSETAPVTPEPSPMSGAESKSEGPGAMAATQPPAITDLEQLTGILKGMEPRKRSMWERVGLSRDLLRKEKAKVQRGAIHAVDELLASVIGAFDYLDRPTRREWTNWDDIRGEYLKDRQVSSVVTSEFAKEALAKKSDVEQEAVVAWIEAEGDVAELVRMSSLSTGDRKAAYDRAASFTPDEVTFAANVGQYFESMLDQAIKYGLLEHGVENYVNHIWEKDNPSSNATRSAVRQGLLQRNPQFAKKRVLKSYFEGEQLGYTPKDKRIGFLITAYNESFFEAIAARKFIDDLRHGKASDGRPLVAIEGSASRKSDDPYSPETVLVTPHTRPEELGDYALVNHRALRNWKWVDTASDGTKTMLQGDMIVHPEIASHLKKILTPSALREWTPTRIALEISAELKASLLSLSGFHQVQEGTHAVFHKVTPAGMPKIDIHDPVVLDAMKHGLMISDHSGRYAFLEGVGASGLVNKIPGIGPYLRQYTQWLFSDYIPRLKMALYSEAVKRNTGRYLGKLTDDQIKALTAEQANAAFGELNYKDMGRNQTFQDVLRLMLLAPDFLEARGRFVGQAVKPYGREQAAALIRGALGMYVVARVLNTILSDDHDPHWDKPFGVVVGDREYTLRSVPGDVYHLFRDARSFLYHRLNPTITRTAVEALTSRDVYGRYKSWDQQVIDVFKNYVPIPFQGPMFKRDQTIIDSVLSAMGIASFKSRSSAEKKALELVMFRLSGMGRSERELDRSEIRNEIADEIKMGNKTMADAAAMVKEGKLTPRDLEFVKRSITISDLERHVEMLPFDMAMQVWEKADTSERLRLMSPMMSKMGNAVRNAPLDQREEVMKQLETLRLDISKLSTAIRKQEAKTQAIIGER